MDRIYLDYNASTPIDPRVAEVMRPLLESAHGNPSSLHWAGRPAREAVEAARGQVAAFLGCSTGEVVFTSGGSEANNHAIQGVFFAWLAGRPLEEARRAHFVTSVVEHPAVLEPLRFLGSLGATITVVEVDADGRVDPSDVARALTSDTLLVSVMHANNEVGTVQPVREIAEAAHRVGALFHTDAAQSAGKIPVRVGEIGADLLSLAGHKLYGPKGVGALYVRSGVHPASLIRGAGHESGRRAGTESAFLAAALGQACAIAGESLEEDASRIRRLRDRFERTLEERFGSRVMVNAQRVERLPNTSSVNFVGRTGAEVLEALAIVAASTGSACHSGSVELSPVLRAMGVPPDAGMGAVRFSLGRWTTGAAIEEVLDRLTRVLR